MIDLNDYFYYVQVVEKQGFSAAAEALSMPKSRLSRHVKNLEERLKVRLIQRTSRQFHVTDAGRLFYQHARSMVDAMELTEAVMQRQQNVLAGRVSISCSVGVAQFALQELVLDFLEQHPKVELMQHVANETVDLVAAGIDLAVRAHVSSLPDSSLVQRHLAAVPWYLYAGPAFFEKYGEPTTPYDLFKQRALKMGWQPSEGHWNLQNKAGLKTSVPYTAILSSDDMSTLKTAAIRGLGLVALPAYTCKKEIAAKELVRILPEWHAGIANLTILLPSRKGVSAQTQVLRDFLLEKLEKYLQA